MSEEPPKKPKTDRPQNKNLKPQPWKKGQSGNKKGKALGTLNRSTILKRYMDATLKDGNGKTKSQPFGMRGEPLTVAEAINLALIKKALNGDLGAIKEIQDSLYGKLTDKSQIGFDPDAPIVFKLNMGKDLGKKENDGET